MKIAIKHSTVHLLHPDSTETVENVGNIFAHDVPLIHARRCKGVRWLIKNEQQRKQRKRKTTEGGKNTQRLKIPDGKNPVDRGKAKPRHEKTRERAEKKLLKNQSREYTKKSQGKETETETGEENKKPTYPSFAFIFRTQTQWADEKPEKKNANKTRGRSLKKQREDQHHHRLPLLQHQLPKPKEEAKKERGTSS